MIKKIAQKKREEARNNAFSRSADRSSEATFPLKNNEFRNEDYKSSTFTGADVESSLLINKDRKPPLNPTTTDDKEEKSYIFEQKLNPTPQCEDDEIMDSQFLSSNSSVNDISDIEEHSGLKKLEKHLGNNESLGQTSFDQEEQKVQLVTEISQCQDEEIIESSQRPIQETNISIKSKRMEEYNDNSGEDNYINSSYTGDEKSMIKMR